MVKISSFCTTLSTISRLIDFSEVIRGAAYTGKECGGTKGSLQKLTLKYNTVNEDIEEFRVVINQVVWQI